MISKAFLTLFIYDWSEMISDFNCFMVIRSKSLNKWMISTVPALVPGLWRKSIIWDSWGKRWVLMALTLFCRPQFPQLQNETLKASSSLKFSSGSMCWTSVLRQFWAPVCKFTVLSIWHVYSATVEHCPCSQGAHNVFKKKKSCA